MTDKIVRIHTNSTVEEIQVKAQARKEEREAKLRHKRIQRRQRQKELFEKELRDAIAALARAGEIRASLQMRLRALANFEPMAEGTYIPRIERLPLLCKLLSGVELDIAMLRKKGK